MSPLDRQRTLDRAHSPAREGKAYIIAGLVIVAFAIGTVAVITLALSEIPWR